MAERLGKMIECDRCGKTHFLDYTGTKSYYGTNVEHFTHFANKPDGWKDHIEIGLLCDECEKAYQELLDEFFDR